MARRNTSFQDLFLNSLNQAGTMAMQGGKLIGDTNRENAESKARLGLVEQQTNAAKLDYDKMVKEEMLKKALEDATGAQSQVFDGTPTADGHAVDFQQAKKANKSVKQADRALWNFLNPGSPMNDDQLATKRERDETVNALEVGDRQAKSEREANAETRAQEAHASQLKNDAALRQKGSYVGLGTTPEGNALILDSRGGKVIDSGVGKYVPAPSGGSKKDVVIEGETLIPNMEPIKGVEITKDSVKKTKDALATYQAFKNQLTEYGNLVKDQGSELIGEKADRADAMVADMGMKLKELQNLGVLTGNDWQLMMKQIPKTSGALASAKSAAYGLAGADPFGPRIDVLNTSVDDKFKVFAETNGFRKIDAPGGASGSWDDDAAAADAVFGPSSAGGGDFDFQRFKKGRQ